MGGCGSRDFGAEDEVRGGGAGLGPSLVGWSNDFRGPESEASWTQGLGSRKGGSKESGANHPPSPTSKVGGWEEGGSWPALTAVCHCRVIWLLVGAVSATHASWALACGGDVVRKSQEHKARKPQGKSQACSFFPTGFPIMGPGEEV